MLRVKKKKAIWYVVVTNELDSFKPFPSLKKRHDFYWWRRYITNGITEQGPIC